MASETPAAHFPPDGASAVGLAAPIVIRSPNGVKNDLGAAAAPLSSRFTAMAARHTPSTSIIFDLDGVIVDSRSAITSCIKHALAVHGLDQRQEDELHRFIGPRIAAAFAELTMQPVDSELVRACVTTFRERYANASLSDTTVVEEIPQVLAKLREDHQLAVATSNPLAFTLPLLEALHLRELFTVVAGPDLTAHGQDKTETIGAALDQLGTRHAIMVGDRRHDVAGAHAHGIPAIGVSWGIGRVDELAAAGADALVEVPSELIAVSRELLQGSAE